MYSRDFLRSRKTKGPAEGVLTMNSRYSSAAALSVEISFLSNTLSLHFQICSTLLCIRLEPKHLLSQNIPADRKCPNTGSRRARPWLVVNSTSLVSFGSYNAALDVAFERSRRSCTLWNWANEPSSIVKLASWPSRQH
jgi:hypothetical protein